MTAKLKRYSHEFGGFEEHPNGPWCKITDVEAYTQAAIAAAMMGTAVKPLEWRRDDRDDGIPEWIAVCCIGKYEIRHGSRGYTARIVFSREENTQWGYFDSDLKAKLTVKQHYQKSILSTLSIPTDALAALEAAKAAVRAEIAEWLDTLPNDTTPAGAAILLRKGGA